MTRYQDVYIRLKAAENELSSLEKEGAGWHLKRRMRAVIKRWRVVVDDEFQRRLSERVEAQEKMIDDYEADKEADKSSKD